MYQDAFLAYRYETAGHYQAQTATGQRLTHPSAADQARAHAILVAASAMLSLALLPLLLVILHI